MPAIPPEQLKLTEDLPGQTALETKEAPWRIAGEVLRTYIICESADGCVWLIDKHAAHERINFDKLKNAQEPPMRQTLLAPIAALKSTSEGTCLFVKADTRPDNAVDLEDGVVPDGFYAVPVETGLYDVTKVEITRGLSVGQEIFLGYENPNEMYY